MRCLFVLLLCFVAAGGAHAQEIRGGYVGIGAGFFSYEDTDDESGLRISDGTGSYRILGGYQLNSNYAVDVTWTRTSEISERLFGSDPLGNLVSLNLGVEYEIAAVRLLAYAPFQGLSMFGGIGYYDASFTSTFTLSSQTNPQSGSFKGSDDGVTVVGGLQFDWDRIALRGEYEWFDTSGNVEATEFNLSVLYRF